MSGRSIQSRPAEIEFRFVRCPTHALQRTRELAARIRDGTSVTSVITGMFSFPVISVDVHVSQSQNVAALGAKLQSRINVSPESTEISRPTDFYSQGGSHAVLCSIATPVPEILINMSFFRTSNMIPKISPLVEMPAF